MKSSGDISGEFVRQGLQTTSRGPNPAREAVSSCPPGPDEGEATGAVAPGPHFKGAPRDDIYLFLIKHSFENFRDS